MAAEMEEGAVPAIEGTAVEMLSGGGSGGVSGGAREGAIAVPGAVTGKKRTAYRFVKRAFDVICAGLAMVVLLPVFLAVAVFIKREDGGPVLYRRICVGKNGKAYLMYKFRTMAKDAEDLGKYLTAEQMEEYRKNIKLTDDPRITKVGRILRRFSLDELPQLVNILIGDMSFVGPRPIVEAEVAFYSEEERGEILAVKPGLTGYWQVNGRSDSTYESGDRQRLELYYARNRGFLLDLKILAKTVGVVVRRGGAY